VISSRGFPIAAGGVRIPRRKLTHFEMRRINSGKNAITNLSNLLSLIVYVQSVYNVLASRFVC
jgi:hypothetical protein